MSADWFAGRLREVRATAGLTQKELAERIGVTIDGLAKLERGERKPGWETVVALCDALNVSCDTFRTPPAVAETAPRGRPRKEPAGDSTPPTPQRKRGRPRVKGS